MTPIGSLLIAPLEDRFPLPPADVARALRDHHSGRSDQGRRKRGARAGRRSTRASGSSQAAILARRYPERASRLHRRQRLADLGEDDPRGGGGQEAARRTRRRPVAGDARGAVPQHRRERALHRGAGSPPARPALAAGDVRVSHAPIDGAVREGRVRRRRLSGRLPDARPRPAAAVVARRGGEHLDLCDRGEGMGRPARPTGRPAGSTVCSRGRRGRGPRANLARPARRSLTPTRARRGDRRRGSRSDRRSCPCA